MIRCGVYLRQSEDADDDELAVSRQWNEIIEKICTPRGWEPVRYCDNDKTAVGKKRKLPDRDRMLKDIEAGQLQAMAVWDCDRLYREPIDLEHIIDVFEARRILLATVTGDIDLGTDNGRLFARVKGAFAKAETERRSARQKAKGKQLADSGDNCWSVRPFGYNLDGSIVEHEALALRQAYELVLSGHHNLIAICRMWNEAGIPTAKGATWRSQTPLRKILTSPRNAGLRTYHDQIVGKAKWEPIVDRDVWQVVHDILTDPARLTGPSPGPLYDLVGIALCGKCAAKNIESTMDTSRYGPSKRSCYRCRTCFGISRDQLRADDHIKDLVVARLSRPDAAELLVDQKRPDLDKLRREAAAAREKLKTLAADWVKDVMTDEQLMVGTRETKARLRAAEAAMEDANKARLFKGIVGEDAPKFRELHLDRRRAVINALMTIIFEKASKPGVFNPSDIVIGWRDGLGGAA